MARWKYSADGQLYYDTQDSGPDQGTPTAEQLATQGQTASAAPGTAPTGTISAPTDWSKYATDISSSVDSGLTPMDSGGITQGSNGTTQPVSTSTPNVSDWYAQRGATPLGFDQAKWDDPNKSDPKYDAGRMKASGMTDESIGAAIQSKYPGYKYLGGDKILGPDGHVYDFDFASHTGAGSSAWTDTGDPNHPTTGTGASRVAGIGASALGGMFGSGAASSGLSSLFGGGDAQNLYNILMQRAGQSLIPSSKDPIIANQVNAYSAQQQRSGRDYIDDLAESRGPISNLQGEKRLIAEKEGQATGGFQAQLMQNEVNARRQEIQQALTGAMGFLTDQQRMQLQRELEYLNMSQRAYEFDSSDEFRRSPLGS